ncbi:MAG: 3'(2'),5'-bisphosphate nucleotidase CysQ [Bdellovibrionia bacterium]
MSDAELDLAAQAVSNLVQEVGREILPLYGSSTLDIRAKEDNSPLTEADLLAHSLLAKDLVKIVDVPVLSEEDVVPFETRAPWTKFWLVDPIDGTKGFIRQTGDFSINVALVENGRAILGVIAVPVANAVYCARRGGGTFKNGNPVSNERTGGPTHVVMSRSQARPEVEEFLRSRGILQVDRFHSALKFGLLAEGLYDFSPRWGPTYEWDTAAGQIILEEAKCRLVHFHTGNPLEYNKADLVNPPFLAMRSNLDWADFQNSIKPLGHA